MFKTPVLYGVKHRLQTLVRTGKAPASAPRPSKTSSAKTPRVILPNSLNKCIHILKERYDGLIKDSEGKNINLYSLKPSDLYTYTKDSKSLEIFRALMHIKKIDKKPISKNVLYTLLGVNSETLTDRFHITKTVQKLLETDENHERALYLLKLSDKSNVVAMNKIMEWLLKKNDIKTAMKVFNDRKKWGIDPNDQTYVILFDGVAKASEWGKMPDELTATLTSIFKKIPNPQISQFNALLSVVVKNFKREQADAWELFNVVPELGCKPNAQTFTIFLNGLKKYNEMQVNFVKQSKHSKSVKVLKYYGLHNELIETANLILNKMVVLATPPAAPTKEEIDADVEVLKKYLSDAKKTQFIDIDEHFVTTYLSCFINNFSNTGDDVQMSNYNYISQGLKLLQSWSPDVNTLMESLEVSTEGSKALKSTTDFRLSSSKTESANHLKQPGSLIRKSKIVTTEISNPEVSYPPSAKIKNKKRSVLNAKKHPLIDIKLNKFLSMVMIDGLVQLDRPQQFFSVILYYLGLTGVEFKKYPLVRDLTYELAASSSNPDVVDENLVDILLIENFMFKANKMFLKRDISSSINLTILSILQQSGVKPRDRTYSLVFSFLNEEIEYYLKSNFSKIQAAQAENPAHRYTTRKPLYEDQLMYITTNLAKLMDTIPQQNYATLESYNKICSRILNSGWLEFLELEQVLLIYKNIVKAGIKYYYENPELQKNINRGLDVLIKDSPDAKLKKLSVAVKKAQYVARTPGTAPKLAPAQTENLNKLYNYL